MAAVLAVEVDANRGGLKDGLSGMSPEWSKSAASVLLPAARLRRIVRRIATVPHAIGGRVGNPLVSGKAVPVIVHWRRSLWLGYGALHPGMQQKCERQRLQAGVDECLHNGYASRMRSTTTTRVERIKIGVRWYRMMVPGGLASMTVSAIAVCPRVGCCSVDTGPYYHGLSHLDLPYEQPAVTRQVKDDQTKSSLRVRPTTTPDLARLNRRTHLNPAGCRRSCFACRKGVA